MAGNRNITNIITNRTSYSFEMIDEHLSSGIWLISPRPIAANSADTVAFQARGVNGTATGAVGYVVYSVIRAPDGAAVGKLTLKFSDPYSGHNECSAKPEGKDLKLTVTNDCPKSGSTFNVNWDIWP